MTLAIVFLLGTGFGFFLCLLLPEDKPNYQPYPKIHPAAVEAAAVAVVEAKEEAAEEFTVAGKPKPLPWKLRRRELEAKAKTKRRKLEEYRDA